MELPIKTKKDDQGKPVRYIEPTDKDLQEIADKATPKAALGLEAKLKGIVQQTLGINTLDLKDVVPALRTKLRDPEVDNIDEGKQPIGEVYKALHPGKTELNTHRYTIHVPDEGEDSVLNLGHGDGSRKMTDAGITARTFNHIHLHTKNDAHASMIALGGNAKAPHAEIKDPGKALEANEGISAITNGHLWAEAVRVVNVASHTDETILRAHKKNVRVQADEANVEVGAQGKVAVGGVDGVNIVSSSDVNCGENAYGTGFKEELVKSSGKVAGKDLVTMLDAISASVTAVKGFSDKDWFYERGKLSQTQKANDKHKLVVDAVKALSSWGRLVAGKVVGGQVKIAADNFASITGMLGASMYGHLSASVSSLLSASVVGGTASLKGLQWASVWAANGVSMRTVHGSASVRSENGKVTLSAKDEIGISSRKGVNIGGDKYAELKCGNGPVWIGSPKAALISVGEGEGHALLVTPTVSYLGLVTGADTTAPKRKPNTPSVQISSKVDQVVLRTRKASVTVKKERAAVDGKKVNIG